jgi:outer membrane protein W
MRRLLTVTAALMLASLAWPSNSHAQQSVNVYLGGFFPRSFDARDTNDVLRDNTNFFDFRLTDFNGPTVGAEYLVGLCEHFDAGLGVGFYSRTVPSVDATSVFDTGASIRQDFRLRMVPFTATVRYLPLGRSDAFEPYIGAGVGVIRFRYQETGDFVDANENVYSGTFTGTGAATGPVILGGARFPVGAFSIGGEIRYQYAKGDLPLDQFFVPKIDLGGFSYLATFKIRF